MPPKKKNELSNFIAQRNIAQANIQRIYDFVLESGESLQASELDCRLEIVETYFLQALNHQSSIEELGNDAENACASIVRTELEDLFCQTKVKIKTLMQAKVGSNKNFTQQVITKMPDNLPKLKLPTFSGKYSEFPNFMRLFTKLVDEEPRLSTIVKFNHLVSCLSGAALRTIRALDLIEENYVVALKLLKERFDNKYLMCQDHVKELFQLNKVQKGSPEQLRVLIDTVSANFNALSSMLSKEEICNVFIVHICSSALDSESQAKLDESIDCSKMLSWDECSKVLKQRCQMLETREAQASSHVPIRSNKPFNKTSKPVALSAGNNNCKCCNSNCNQPLWNCPEFIKKTPLQRFDKVKELSLCINCFSSEHTARNCKSSLCKKCKGLHNTLLHRETTNNSSSSSTRQHGQGQQTQQQQQQCLTTNNTQQQLSPEQQLTSQSHQWHLAPSFLMPSCNSTSTASAETMVEHQSSLVSQKVSDQTLLATAMVTILDKFGNKHFARALLDSASQLNFITQSFSQRLYLDKQPVTTVIGGIGQSETQAKFSTTANISSCTSTFTTSLQLLILPTITGVQPHQNIDIRNWNIPDSVILADPQFNKSQKVDLLIGADVFFELFDGQQIKLAPHCPILMHTVFGWVVSGRCKNPKHTSLISNSTTVNFDIELQELVKQFWELEKVPEAKPKLTSEQTSCESQFTSTTRRLQCGRFEVRLPFKQSPDVLGNSKPMAIRRFLSLEKRLSADENLKQAYAEFLKQYEDDGHMQQIPWPESLAGYYIMPHQCVLRPEKSTTKLRVVFDASAKTANNVALNDILMVGPVVQQDLVDILLQFRLHKYGLMGDITAMYRQIMVNPVDCKVQNIIWRKNMYEEVKLYRLNTVTYGTASAPYLATRCLVQLAHEYQHINPKACKIIKNNFYVDDLITGGSTLEEIQQIKQDVSKILSSAGFLLRKWFSNHTDFLANIPENEREKTIEINNASVVKTLGIIWDANSDCFKFNYTADKNNTNAVTKRKVLSEMSKLFDPLGLVKPVIVKAKIFLQELWLKNLQWDELIPDDSAKAWNNFVQHLVDLNNVAIPRCVLLGDTEVELHCFADASTRAYGCCMYFRCVDNADQINVNLFTSRSKVAPISTVRTLPCLELCAAHLMTEVFIKVRNIHKFTNVYFWSDSVIVLQWIEEHASNFNTFVANRVSYIQENTQGIPWRYVPSGSNPADFVSRGATVQDLTSSIWFSGPQFLQKPKQFWPQHPKERRVADLPERKQLKTVLLSTHNEFLNFIYTCSSFDKICATMAYVRRFITNIRNKTKRQAATSIALSAEEKDVALISIISLIQHAVFASEIFDLAKGSQVHQKSTLKALNPFLEKEYGFAMLKVGGRLKNSELPYIAKCPIILPKQNKFVRTYVRNLHYKNLHAGAQALLTLLEKRFWIIGAREYARKVVRHCVHCFKYRAKLMSQLMGDLPKHRVTPAKPFTHCGVDFCGPVMTTSRVRGKPQYKSYIAVFVCFVTRAVHLEVVSGLTTDAFIAALKRFIGRRGLCSTLYCDNATNFVGARNVLKEFNLAFNNDNYQHALKKWCSSNDINFKHIPPRAPHFGGIWEAAVKSAKSLLYKTMQATVLTFEELSTVMAQIEGMLNSRPITVISTDPNEERALTPAHFLNQSNSECILEPPFSFQNISTLKHWEKISAIQQHFWNRWSSEYLTLLQQRRKWTKDMPNIEAGTIVMVHEDNLPPQKWVIGRITNVVKGADGKIRVVDIKTPSGDIRRSIHKVAALPIEINENAVEP